MEKARIVKYINMIDSSDVNASDGINFIVNDKNRYITLWVYPYPNQMINASKNIIYARKVKIGNEINLADYLSSLKLIKNV